MEIVAMLVGIGVGYYLRPKTQPNEKKLTEEEQRKIDRLKHDFDAVFCYNENVAIRGDKQ